MLRFVVLASENEWFGVPAQTIGDDTNFDLLDYPVGATKMAPTIHANSLMGRQVNVNLVLCVAAAADDPSMRLHVDGSVGVIEGEILNSLVARTPFLAFLDKQQRGYRGGCLQS
jgi:hypothetical protein